MKRFVSKRADSKPQVSEDVFQHWMNQARQFAIAYKRTRDAKYLALLANQLDGIDARIRGATEAR
jgi:hypothetical protein